MNNTICYRSHYYKTATIQIILDSSTSKQNGMITFIIIPVTWQITGLKWDTKYLLRREPCSNMITFTNVHVNNSKASPKSVTNSDVAESYLRHESKGELRPKPFYFWNQCRKESERLRKWILNFKIDPKLIEDWNSESFYVGSDLVRHWFEKIKGVGSGLPLKIIEFSQPI